MVAFLKSKLRISEQGLAGAPAEKNPATTTETMTPSMRSL
jgi:hypothetical protein